MDSSTILAVYIEGFLNKLIDLYRCATGSTNHIKAIIDVISSNTLFYPLLTSSNTEQAGLH